MKAVKSIFLFTIMLVAQSVFSQDAASKLLELDQSTNCRIRYYYFPNLEAYYDKTQNVYIFKEHGEWMHETEIPSGYRGYGLYNKVNVAITDYDDDDPTQFFAQHKKKYPYNSLKPTRGATASID